MGRKRKVYRKPKKKRVIAGKTYSLMMCYRRKATAKKRAEGLRADKKQARIIQMKGRHCVYKRG